MSGMTSAEVKGWLRLTQTRGVGARNGRKLLAAFGLPENIFTADRQALQAVVSAAMADALLAPPDPAHIDLTLAWLDLPGNDLLTLADADYPPALLEIADPPLLLHVKGRRALLGQTSIAVVGSRNATPQGAVNAEQFSAALSATGLGIVSGLALGIDAAAHRGALKGSGSTVAVIGTGADVIYPARNQALARQIVDQGCLVSEYPLGTPAVESNFPRRNRIISGLSRGVLVVEAAARSGSLITARLAAEQGREVFAIPGSIHSPLAKGCHQLIRQGAKLVETAQDVLEELRLAQAPASPVAVTETDSALLAAMGYDPVDLDTLADRCALAVEALSAQLLPLELAGRIALLPGGQYQRIC
jgi:DNA processing protein